MSCLGMEDASGWAGSACLNVAGRKKDRGQARADAIYTSENDTIENAFSLPAAYAS